jgi:rhodanese-related sulfurtransferase
MGMTRSFAARLLALAGALFGGPFVHAAEVDRIEAQEAKRLVDKGEAVIVDVRSQASWDMGHVQGALHVPLDELEARLSQLPKNKLIVAYCT